MAKARLYLICWSAFALLAVSLQWSRGALNGSWNGFPDEPAHVLNGLMVLDYLKSGPSQLPLPYAERYYAHYPKIGLGHWPPLFALTEAAWFLLAPHSYASSLVLLALLAATIGTILVWLCRQWFPWWFATAVGAGWMLLPAVRIYAEMFMAEMLLTLILLLGVIAFARGSKQFGLFGGLALLTKGSGIALAPLPLVAAVLSGDWNRLRERWLWISAGIAILLAAPWYLLAPGARHEKVGVMATSGEGALRRLAGSAPVLWDLLGPVACLLAILGVGIACSRLRQDRYWLALVAFLPAHLVFRAAISVWESRQLMIATPELLCLAALGAWELGRALPWPGARQPVAAALLVFTMASLPFSYRPRPALPAPASLAAAIAPTESVLISGGSSLEGALIVELALRDPHRPSRTVARGTKVLASMDMLGGNYRSLVQSDADVEPILRRLDTQVVVADQLANQAHTRVLLAYLNRHRQHWIPAGLFSSRYHLYRRADPPPERLREAGK